MRILYTGMLSRQITEEPFKKDYTPLGKPLLKALRALGHQVTTRKVAVGENIRGEFDLAFVGINSYNSLPSIGLRYGALWAASQLPHVCFIEDWQLAQTCGAMKDPEGTLWRMDSDDQLAAMKLPQIHATAERLRKIDHIMLPVHAWGNAEGYRKHHKAVGTVHAWDPTPMLWDEIDMDRSALRERKKAWFCVSLSDVSKLLSKLELKWPVEGYWDKKIHTYVLESDILETHLREYAGTVMPTHFPLNAVAGWWRARTAHYAARLIPVCANPEEMGTIGHAYPAGKDIELMSDSERRLLALDQRGAVMGATWPVQHSLDTLAAIIRNARMEP